MLSGLFRKQRPVAVDVTKEIERWWQVFSASDERRAKEPVYCLPCNLESPGNPNSARLNFTIPDTKPVLISVVNAISYAKHRDANKEKMLQDVKEKIDNITEMYLRIDEIDATKHATRICSDFFDLDYDHLAISDGYWVMLQPLWQGLHIIERGACTDNSKASTYYNIHVV